jgi:PIN domain nuclease of toxin-antitoxin system
MTTEVDRYDRIIAATAREAKAKLITRDPLLADVVEAIW